MDMKPISRSPISFLRNNPAMFFGKSKIAGFDIFQMMIEQINTISDFEHAIRFKKIFVISSKENWILNYSKNYDDYFSILALNSFEEGHPNGANSGALLFAFCKEIFIWDGNNSIEIKGKGDGAESIFTAYPFLRNYFVIFFYPDESLCLLDSNI